MEQQSEKQQSLDEQLEKAMQLHAAGKFAEAQSIYQTILKQDPNDADALHLLGALTAQLGRGEDALVMIDRAIALDPACADFHNNRGLILFNLGRVDDAIAAHREAVRLRPNFPEAHNNLGNALLKKGQLDEAIAAYRQTIALRPDYANAHSNLGVALHKQRKLEDAIAAYRQAVRYQPNHAEAHSNLGVALKESGRVSEAIEEYQAAIGADPRCIDAHSNLGAALLDVGRDDEAIAILERTIKLSPEYEAAHYNLALGLLKSGDFQRGWEEYEHRAIALLVRRKFAAPQWDGRDLGGKTLLLFAEGGFGDVIQFSRYVPMVKKRASTTSLPGKIIFQVRPELIRLLSGLGADELVSKDQAPPRFDLHCPLLSLAGIFKTQPNNVPNSAYLSADPAIAGQWASRLGEKTGNRIGLTWRGDPKHRNDPNRSIDPAMLSPLAETRGVTLVNLQARDAKSELTAPPAGVKLVDFTNQLSDFAETAGLIDNLDLVISVDTAVAHLAGAMGKKVWLLLPYVGEWRWLKDRRDSPWYPTMRIFRQPAAGDWKSVISEVVENLKSPPM